MATAAGFCTEGRKHQVQQRLKTRQTRVAQPNARERRHTVLCRVLDDDYEVFFERFAASRCGCC